jgi:hypothetical protein
LTARGNEQKDLFKSQKDREQFLSYLEFAVSGTGNNPWQHGTTPTGATAPGRRKK